MLGEFRRRERADRDASGTGGPAITPRETEVLRLVAKGLTADGSPSGSGSPTAPSRTTCRTCCASSSCTNRVELARYAIEQGLDADS